MATADFIRDREASQRGIEGPADRPIVNVGDTERMASQIGGGALIVLGLLRRGLPGLLTAAVGGGLLYRGITGHCSVYQAIGANTADDDRGPVSSVSAQQGAHVEESMTINRPREELYRYWRDYANLPKFMENVESVTMIDDDPKRSHWVAKGPMGAKVEWDAEIHNEKDGELIAWRSTEGGDVDTAGSVRFVQAPAGRGTEIHVNQKFNPPGGKIGVAVSKLFGADPQTQTRGNLRRLKQLMEAGEIPTLQGQSSGRA